MKTPLINFSYMSQSQSPKTGCNKIDPDHYDKLLSLSNVPEKMFTVQLVFDMDDMVLIHYGKNFFPSMNDAYEYVMDRWEGRWHRNMKNVLIIQQGATSLMDQKTTMILNKNLCININGKFDISKEDESKLENMLESLDPQERMVARLALKFSFIAVSLILVVFLVGFATLIYWLCSLWN